MPTQLTDADKVLRNDTGLAIVSKLEDVIDVLHDISIDRQAELNAMIDRSITSIKSDTTSIGTNAFNGCSSLTTVDFPEATSIGDAAFNACFALTTINFPKVTSIGTSAFNNCNHLTTADFPEATSIGINAFQKNSALTTVNFPKVTSISNNVFYNNGALTSVDFPEVISIGNWAFYNNYALTTADFSKATSIAGNVFNGCVAFNTLILRSSTVCTLANINSFSATKFTSGIGGTLYVPQALISSYQAANNWSTILGYANNQIKAIEGSPYEIT